MVRQRLKSAFAVAVVPSIKRGSRDAELVQRALGRQMRLLDQLDDLSLLGRRISHASSSPSPFRLFLSRRFSRVRLKREDDFLLGHGTRRHIPSSSRPGLTGALHPSNFAKLANF